MIVIADNLNTRNRAYMDALAKRDRDSVAGLAKQLAGAGADMINIQCSLDGAGDEEMLPWVAGIITDTVDCGISLDSRNTAAVQISISACSNPPLVNFISRNEPADRERLVSLIADSEASLVLRASSGMIPVSLEAKLQILEELMELANESDIPNERLFADPSVVHMGRGMGQKHLVNSRECIMMLRELVEPPLNTIAWISNISTGLSRSVKKPLEAAFLTYLAGAGLDAAMVDVMDEHIRKTLYLIKAFRDEVIFSQADIS